MGSARAPTLRRDLAQSLRLLRELEAKAEALDRLKADDPAPPTLPSETAARATDGSTPIEPNRREPIEEPATFATNSLPDFYFGAILGSIGRDGGGGWV